MSLLYDNLKAVIGVPLRRAKTNPKEIAFCINIHHVIFLLKLLPAFNTSGSVWAVIRGKFFKRLVYTTSCN